MLIRRRLLRQFRRGRRPNEAVLSQMLVYLAKIRRMFQRIALRAIVYLVRFPPIQRMAFYGEVFFLRRLLERTTAPGPSGGAIGYLFFNHDPDLSAKDIYQKVFSAQRFSHGYQSQVGQDLFLNKWFFKNRGPGFFVDVGAFDGISGSNTYYFEKYLNWHGIAFEPNPSAFEILSTTRSCHLIQGCAYHQDGEVPLLALSESKQPTGAKQTAPCSQLSMVFDSIHGGAMLSGIPEHMNQLQWIKSIREPMKLNETVVTVPCHRIDTILNDFGVKIVDYLSIDVEGAEIEVLRGIDFDKVKVNIIGVEHNDRFGEVYDLLTRSGFEYQGLLFFDEIFAHKHMRYSWDI